MNKVILLFSATYIPHATLAALEPLVPQTGLNPVQFDEVMDVAWDAGPFRNFQCPNTHLNVNNAPSFTDDRSLDVGGSARWKPTLTKVGCNLA